MQRALVDLEPNGSPAQVDDQISANGFVRLRIEKVSAMENERKYSTKTLISHFNWELISRKTFPMIPERVFKAAEGRQNRFDTLLPFRRYERDQANQPNMLRLIPLPQGAVHRRIRRIASDDEEEVGPFPQSAAAKDDNEQIDVKPEPFLSLLLTCAEQKTRQNGWKCMANVELTVSSAKKTRSWFIDDVNFSSSSGVHNEPVFNRTFVRIPWPELTSDFIGASESGQDWLQICACLNITEQIGYGLLPMNDVLIVNDCNFSVNKAYLAAFSNFFRTMFFSPVANNAGMLGGDQGEHQITDPTDNINGWKLMLKIAIPNGAQPNDELIVDVLHLADKYDLPNVTEICEQFLLEKSKLPIIQKLGLADQYKLTNLKKHSIQQIDPVDFCEVLQESVNIYNELSGSMRKQLNMRMKNRVRRTRIVEESDDEDQPGPSGPKRLRSRARACSPPPAPTFTCRLLDGFRDRGRRNAMVAIARGRAVQPAAIPNQAPPPQPFPPPRPTAPQN